MWYYKGKEFKEDINKYDSFVYLITRLIDDEKKPKYYIGKKTFWFTSRKKVKGKTRKEVTKKASDWIEYYGSSDWLNEIIEEEGTHNFRREIIHLCKSKGESFILEAKEQLKNNVLTKKFPNGTKKFYNKQILGKYTKEYYSEDELNELMSIENSMNSTGKVWITDGNVSKLIKETEPIPSGFSLGYHYGINYCWVNDGKSEFKIPRSDIDSLEYRDLNVGRLYNPTKNKICVFKLDKVKYIREDELPAYEYNGWTKGNLNLKKTLDDRDKIYVCKDDTKEQKLINRNEVENFLEQNQEWRIGQFKRGNFTTENLVIAYDMNTMEKVKVTKEEYENDDNLTSAKTKKVKVKKNNRIVFEGFFPKFIKEFEMPKNPFLKKLREGDKTPIEIKKGKNLFLNENKWVIVEL